MNKKLPRIFKGELEKTINNNRSVYYVGGDNEEFSFSTRKNEEDINKNIDVSEKLNNIFKPGHHSFNIGVIIKTKDKTYDTHIAGKIKDYIVTLDNEVIKLDDIIDINVK